MVQFPIATETKTFKIEGQAGTWVKVSYGEAKARPDAVRAAKGNTIAWFIPGEEAKFSLEEVEVEDLTISDI